MTNFTWSQAREALDTFWLSWTILRGTPKPMPPEINLGRLLQRNSSRILFHDSRTRSNCTMTLVASFRVNYSRPCNSSAELVIPGPHPTILRVIQQKDSTGPCSKCSEPLGKGRRKDGETTCRKSYTPVIVPGMRQQGFRLSI